MKFVHSSDWQIGRVFRFADDATLAVLAEARLDAIDGLASLARAEGAPRVVVAGDVWDTDGPGDRMLRAPFERMRAHPSVDWHLIPGNHDPHRPGGPFDRARRDGPPDNVHLHLAPGPVPFGPGAVLLPAVLTERHAAADPTRWFDDARSPPGTRRIGLAHGSVRGFGAGGDRGHNLVAPDRARRAGLDYLALGDWHGAQEAAHATWYAGTPEIDDFRVGGRGGGEALLVTVGADDGTPLAVAPRRIGRFAWERMDADLFGPDDVSALEGRIRALAPTVAPSLDRVLLELRIAGRLTLDAASGFAARIDGGVRHALRFLRLDRSALGIAADAVDLDAFQHGPIRVAAERLARRAATGDPVAADALLRLAVLGGTGENGGASRVRAPMRAAS